MAAAPTPTARDEYIEYRPHAGWDLLIERPPGQDAGTPRLERRGDLVARLYPSGMLRILDPAGNEVSVLSPSGWWAISFAEQP